MCECENTQEHALKAKQVCVCMYMYIYIYINVYVYIHICEILISYVYQRSFAIHVEKEPYDVCQKSPVIFAKSAC